MSFVNPYAFGTGGGGGPSYPTAVRAVWDAEDLAASLADNTDVASWVSSDPTYTATGLTTKPKFRIGIVNGRGVVRSTSGNDGMALTSTLLDSSTLGTTIPGTVGGTVIYVGKLAATVSGGALFGDFGNNSPHHYPWTDNHVYESFLGSNRPDWGDFTSVLQTWHIGVLRGKTNYLDWRLAETQRYHDAAWVYSANGSVSGQPPRLFQSWRGGVQSAWAGDLAWWALFEGVLTDSEVLAWEAYLKTLFAL